MQILIKEAKIIAPESSFHNQKLDVLIEKGVIKQVGKDIKATGQVKIIEENNMHISPGWFDPTVSFGEPGYEENETLESGIRAAAAGGYTEVGLLPNTMPAIDNKSAIEFVINKTKDKIVKVHPIGAITKGRKGEEISESFDMSNYGALAFADDRAIENEKVMEISLLYNKTFDKLCLSFPDSPKLSHHGQMNEGEVSTNLGLKGIPSHSEELRVVRDIYLCEYTDSRLHFQNISTEKSTKLIKEAKIKELNITAQCTAFNLCLSDIELEDFNTNYKLMPPLRNKKDQKAIIKAVKNGTIDVVTSDHRPKDVERKLKEFDHASFGSIGLESCFGAINKALHEQMDIEEIIALICQNPRRIFGIDQPKIEVGAQANLTLFDPELQYVFDLNHIKSLSKNSAFLGKTLMGKVIGVYANGQLSLN